MSDKATKPFDPTSGAANYVNIAVTGASAVTAAAVTAKKIAIFNPLRVASAADEVYVQFGATPTAVVGTSFPLVTGINIFNFNPAWKVAAISGGTAITISVMVVAAE